MSETKRGAIKGPGSKACSQCPWRRSNAGKRTKGGWYSKANIRRLWAGIRSGNAPGMTCHLTDPDNPVDDPSCQVPEGTDVRECYGALLLVAREIHFATECVDRSASDPGREYRAARPKGLTRTGLARWVSRFIVGGVTFFSPGPALPKTWTEDDDIQHPDFEAPPKKDRPPEVDPLYEAFRS